MRTDGLIDKYEISFNLWYEIYQLACKEHAEANPILSGHDRCDFCESSRLCCGFKSFNPIDKTFFGMCTHRDSAKECNICYYGGALRVSNPNNLFGYSYCTRCFPPMANDLCIQYD